MPVQIGCAQCGKKYRVDDKLVGKKIRCKECQAVVLVEPVAGQAVMPVKKAAAGPAKSAPVKVAPAKPVPAKSAPVKAAAPAKAKAAVANSSGGGIQNRASHLQPEALDLPDTDYLDLPPGGPIQLDESDMAPVEHPACPSCGADFPLANRVCLGCGYNRASGQRAKTQVQRPSRTQVAYESGASDRDYRGTRLWRPYESPALNFFDVIITKGAMAIFIVLSAISVIGPLLRGMMLGGHPGMVFANVVVQLLSVFLTYTVVLGITAKGVEIAGNLLKFEVPEDARSRVLGTHMVASVASVIVMILAIAMAGGLASGGGGAGPVAGAIASMLIFGVGAYLVVACAVFMLLFHLKIVEAILGYLLMLVFFILGVIAAGAIVLVVGLVIGLVVGGASRAM
jgi:DNA-directed RNA polymerase subunit RPC12/RpoP